MGLDGWRRLLRPAHSVPQTRWSADAPLTFKPRWHTLIALFAGLWLFGTGEAMFIAAGLGVSPWTVLAQGISLQLGWSVGFATFVVSVSVLLLWIPLKEVPGIGTLSNAVLIAIAIDARRQRFPEEASYVYRPLAGREDENRWNEDTRHTVVKDYNLRDMYI